MSIVGFSARPLAFVSQERLTMNGSSQNVTLPGEGAGDCVILITAEGGNVRFAINGTAGATSHLIPQNNSLTLAQVTNLTRLAVYGAPGTYACVTILKV